MTEGECREASPWSTPHTKKALTPPTPQEPLLRRKGQAGRPAGRQAGRQAGRSVWALAGRRAACSQGLVEEEGGGLAMGSGK